MKRKIGLILITAAFFTLIGSGLSFSQEELTENLPEPDVLWLWGEVATIDTQKNELLVKYLDYETEQEKQIAMATDDKTTYENINAFAELKPNDTISIDYIIGLDGKNIAKNISVEKSPPEDVGVEGIPTEILPEELTPEAPEEAPILNNQ